MQRGRYKAVGPEAEFEPGSRGRVLRNLLGIRSVREMALRESDALIAVTDRLLDETRMDQRFTAKDICRIHKLWLADIYPWAGQYRGVNVTKGEFMFAAAGEVPRLMGELERGPLTKYTPCRFASTEKQAQALAVVHVELILIHPFREGNGRCARVLAALLGFQAGLPGLDFWGVSGRTRQRYIAAIHAGLDRDYKPMTLVFRQVINRTLRLQARTLRG